MRFFCGLHHPSDAKHFDACFISVNTIRKRKGPFVVGDWIMDSGAFTEVSTHGKYRHSVEEYAAQIRRWSKNGNLLAAVAQDYMCEPWILEKTGLTVAQHQWLTTKRYDALRAEDTAGVYILPVIQGYAPEEYVAHLRQYGERLAVGAWVGVGSICKRNSNPRAVEAVLLAIKRERPDLRLHGFGLKATALKSALVFDALYSADSMAWSYNARKQGRNANDWREAKRWMRGDRGRPETTVVGVLMPTGWWKPIRAKGICPGCPRQHTGPQFFCFRCRLKASAKAKAWYEKNRAAVCAKERQRYWRDGNAV